LGQKRRWPLADITTVPIPFSGADIRLDAPNVCK